MLSYLYNFPLSLSHLGLPRVLEYYWSSKLLEYFSLLEYSLLSISGCKFLFPVSVFAEKFVRPLASLEIDPCREVFVHDPDPPGPGIA